jgi:hypothetical protein
LGIAIALARLVVLGVCLVLMIAAAVRLMPAHPLALLAFTLPMAALLGSICKLTG